MGGSAARTVAAVLAALLLVVGCARPAAPLPPAPAPASTSVPPVVFPRDAGPHDSLTEWWYYTGHLRTEDGRELGFEFTIFQVHRLGSPTGYLAHFAVSDLAAGRFSHQARTEASALRTGFPLEVGGWRLALDDAGRETIEAEMAPGPGAEAPYALRLRLADLKPPALHNGGYIDYGDPGGSYYYSRTAIAVEGEIRDPAGAWSAVSGQAWMDHQWGNFVVTNAGGWDWFSLQLEDRTELMLYVLRAADGRQSAVYGSRVLADGAVQDLPPGSVRVEVTDYWTSPHTGGVYPAGWLVEVVESDLRLRVAPSLADQELYFPGDQLRGPVYWEGAVRVRGEGGAPGGVGYVELTGYAP